MAKPPMRERIFEGMFKYWIGWPLHVVRHRHWAIQVLGWAVFSIWMLPAMIIAFIPIIIMFGACVILIDEP